MANRRVIPQPYGNWGQLFSAFCHTTGQVLETVTVRPIRPWKLFRPSKFTAVIFTAATRDSASLSGLSYYKCTQWSENRLFRDCNFHKIALTYHTATCNSRNSHNITLMFSQHKNNENKCHHKRCHSYHT